MLWNFRTANGLGDKGHKDLFVSRSELPGLGLGADDTVVLLDDFSGTGTQVCDAWNDPAVSYGELLASVGRVYLILVAATQKAMQKIHDETLLHVVPATQLTHRDNIFDTTCKHFSAHDQQRLLRYCTAASKSMPRGFGQSGLVVVFQHRTPNNSIPILHADSDKWSSLFPRHE